MSQLPPFTVISFKQTDLLHDTGDDTVFFHVDLEINEQLYHCSVPFYKLTDYLGENKQADGDYFTRLRSSISMQMFDTHIAHLLPPSIVPHPLIPIPFVAILPCCYYMRVMVLFNGSPSFHIATPVRSSPSHQTAALRLYRYAPRVYRVVALQAATRELSTRTVAMTTARRRTRDPRLTALVIGAVRRRRF